VWLWYAHPPTVAAGANPDSFGSAPPRTPADDVFVEGALMVSDISKWQHRFDDAAILALQRDVAGLEPESINETPSGAPSKRIAAHLDRYRKVVHGPLAAADIGLEKLRAACPHFAAWLSWLEGLGGPSGAEAGEPVGAETG